jgi:glycyl-tRNA synthetase beta chain
MDRELLIEIGCEELPAGWLPGLTAQLGRHLTSRLKTVRLLSTAPVETFSTPRRLTARVGSLAERQTDLEELVTGPPVSAAFTAEGLPTPAAAGFAKKNGVEVSALERHTTPKGVYLACRRRQDGKAAADVLAEVMAGVLRDFSFPKQMRWDAQLEDGGGELVFARPIRWIVLLYGGRVVPFVIRRTESALGPHVQDVESGSHTYGHRFLATSGQAGRAIKVKTFEDYRARLFENFVMLDRSDRADHIRRQLDTHARRLGGQVSRQAGAYASLLQEVPDLVEWPSVVAGRFPVEFLDLPEEVLTTTMIHHQHYFPVVDEAGRLMPAFLAVTNTASQEPEVIARNSERVLAARLRDAQFFRSEDRKITLESRVERLSTLLFHKKLGSYREKATRVSALAGWIAGEVLGAPTATAALAARAGLLAKADLATDMVRELTELQGVIGGIYAREEGEPEEVWKAIYFQYQPIGVGAEAEPTRVQLGAAAVTWAAVALADKLDSVVRMFSVGERPTGSRDPLGLRRQAQGAVKILADLGELAGVDRHIPVGSLLSRAGDVPEEAREPLQAFIRERVIFLFEQRGFDLRTVRAVALGSLDRLDVAATRRKLEALAAFVDRPEFQLLASAFKRVKNISKDIAFVAGWPALSAHTADSVEAEAQLVRQAGAAAVAMGSPETEGNYLAALDGIAGLQPAVARYFDDVLVMDPDSAIRDRRLQLMAGLRDLVMEIADISEIVSDT